MRLSARMSLLSTKNQTVDRKRLGIDTYVGGRKVTGTEAIKTIIGASVQPPRREFQSIMTAFEEGKRTREWIVVYTDLDTFREADDRKAIPADFVIYEGNTYEVQKVTHRRGIHLNHDVVLAVRLES